MKGEAVILFIHHPGPGSVNPGLARDLGPGRALELEICCIRDMLDAVRGAGALPVVIGVGAAGAGTRGVFGDALRLVQHGRDAGARRCNAFSDVFGRGIRHAVMLCGTGLYVSAPLLSSALGELRTHDAVLGPGNGGDCWLVGLNAGAPGRDLFGGVPWGTSREFMKLLSGMEGALLEVSVLPQVERVRDRAGLLRLALDRERSAGAAYTRAWLELHREEIFGET